MEVALLHDSAWAAIWNGTPLAELSPYVLLAEGHPLARPRGIALEDLVQEPLALLDWIRAGIFSCRCFASAAWSRKSAFARNRWKWCGVRRSWIGYSILATKPANNMTYDGRALVARPLGPRSKTAGW